MGNSSSLPENISSITSGKFTGGYSTIDRDVVNTGNPTIESTRDITDEDIVISEGTSQTSSTGGENSNSGNSGNSGLSDLSNENFWKNIGLDVVNIIAAIIWIICVLYALKYSMACNYGFKQKAFGFIKALLLGPIYLFWLKITCN
jgi:hypothetical protein